MKIWPLDPYAVSSGGNFIHRADLDTALEPFRKIRDAVGDKMEVMVELHSMWDLPSALAIARELRQFRPFWAEDPIKMQDPDALATYARPLRHSGLCERDRRYALPVPRAPTEGRGRLRHARRFRCGGLSEAKKIATMAEAFQRPVAPHDCTGPVVFAASIHLALNLPNAIFQESVRAYYGSWYRDLVTVMPRIADGHIYPFEGAVIGIELSPFVLDHPDAVIRSTRHKDQ